LLIFLKMGCQNPQCFEGISILEVKSTLFSGITIKIE
jgi:hypothetical protein